MRFNFLDLIEVRFTHSTETLYVKQLSFIRRGALHNKLYIYHDYSLLITGKANEKHS